MRTEIAAAIRGISPNLDRSSLTASRKIFEQLHDVAPFSDVHVARDSSYGPHERHRLDVFTLAGGAKAKPVLVYVHGGAFVGGNKTTPGSPYYDNIGVWAARSGFVGVTTTYRLAPDHPWPAGTEDLRGTIGWVREHIAEHGGDPARIVLMGQSAGATHVASYIAFSAHHAAPGGGIVAAVLMSGIYDFARYTENTVAPYLGTDRATYAARSPIGALAATTIPVLFSCSEFDPPAFHAQAAALFDAFFAHSKRSPNYLYLPGHNHISQVAHLGAADTDDPLLAYRLRQFIERAGKGPR